MRNSGAVSKTPPETLRRLNREYGTTNVLSSRILFGTTRSCSRRRPVRAPADGLLSVADGWSCGGFRHRNKCCGRRRRGLAAALLVAGSLRRFFRSGRRASLHRTRMCSTSSSSPSSGPALLAPGGGPLGMRHAGGGHGLPAGVCGPGNRPGGRAGRWGLEFNGLNVYATCSCSWCPAPGPAGASPCGGRGTRPPRPPAAGSGACGRRRSPPASPAR